MAAVQRLGFLLGAMALLTALHGAAAAAELNRYLSPETLARVFPGADHAGDIGGDPPAASVFSENRLVGYVFLTSDAVNSTGYSGKPVKILAGLDLSGRITGAVVVEHQEPILVLGIPGRRLDEFIAQFAGKDLRRRVRVGAPARSGEESVDMVTGATITSLVFGDSVMRAGRRVARARGVISLETLRPGGSVDLEIFHEADWAALLADGSLRRLRVSNGDVAAAFSQKEPEENKDNTFIELFAGLATPAAIGQNLLGFAPYNELLSGLEKGGHVVFVAARGFYSFRGYTYRRTGVFERLQLTQGDKTIRLTRGMHRSVKKLAVAGAPELREVSLFALGPESGFDPAQPWRLEVLVEKDIPEVGTRFAGFPLNYVLPSRLIRTPPSAAEASDNLDQPLWEIRWRDDAVHIVIVSLALLLLLGLLVFQEWVTERGRSVDRFRIAFLVFTLLYIGWYTSAQLSVINVLTFTGALLTEFRWDFFLLEPLIFILWGFVTLALLFWGRGVFCGWLCPFGALQELINRVAVRFNVRQYELPFAVNERLWPLKYVIFLGLLALSLGPGATAETLTEVEPFKTAIALKFVRAWPFVAYAVALLVVSLFVNRVFCRYLCPLGAALAIPANNRMFDWLKRRHQCGSECQVCALRCPVQAIHPDGHIDLHECIYCLDCQSVYHDDTLCPPLAEKRKRRERRLALGRGEMPPPRDEAEATP